LKNKGAKNLKKYKGKKKELKYEREEKKNKTERLNMCLGESCEERANSKVIDRK